MRISSLLFIVSGLLCSAVHGSQVSHYIGLYGIAESRPATQRAQHIFKELASLSDRDILGTELFIVSDQKPWAIALEDGHVVMSDGTVDFIDRSVQADAADAWLAFVLGHELAHIENGDLWYRTQVRNRPGTADAELDAVYASLFESGQNLKNVRDRELRADLDGFFFATLAGYDTSLLFNAASNGENLLELWQHGNGGGAVPNLARVRLKFLTGQMEQLQRDVMYFNSGLRLAHFGRYEEALLVFRKFQSRFPSAAVMTNLAYVYLQLARREMPAHVAYRYWFPEMLEMHSGVPVFDVPRSYRDVLSEEAVNYLEKAAQLLIRTPRKKKGLAEYFNLISAHWYLDEMIKARAVLDDALQKFPDNAQLQGMGALILLGQGTADGDTWVDAKNILEQLVATSANQHNIRFNLARLLSDRRRHAQAKRHWAYLVAHADGVAAPYLAIACVLLNGDQHCAGKRAELPVIPTAVTLGADIGQPPARDILAEWLHISDLIRGVKVDIFQSHSGDQVIALDHRVQIYSASTPAWRTRGELLSTLGMPDDIRPLVNRSVMTFSDVWSALLKGEQVEQVWVAQSQAH